MKKAIIKQELSIYYILPLLLTFSVVPLIVLLKVVQLDSISIQYWTGKTANSDFFSYNKAILLMICTGLTILTYYIGRYNNKLEVKALKQYYIPLAVYAFFIILSALLSKYPITARMGFVDRYEGVFVLLSYLLVTFFAINLIQSEKHLKISIVILFISAAIIGTIGILQYFGLDLFKSQFGKELILTPKYKSSASTMEFTFGKYTIYSTLYNTNFVGSYMAMLFPISFVCFLYVKKRYLKILTGLFTSLMMANWIGCRSRAGYIGGAIAILILLYIYRRAVLQNIKQVLFILLCFAIILTGMNIASGGALMGRFANIFPQSSKNQVVKNPSETIPAARAVRLKDIKFEGKKMSIVSETESLNLELQGNQVVFTDADGKQLPVTTGASGKITFKDQRYTPYSLQYYAGDNSFNVTMGSMKFALKVTDKGFKIYGERGNLLDSLDHPEKFGFEGREKLGSARGYIWSRSIPLLKKTIFVGSGPDTYAMAFPQHDYVGKLLAFDITSEIIDKPHDLYLQIGINTGVISLLAFLALLGIYLWSCIKLYFRRNCQTFAEVIGGAIFTAVIGYLIAGIFNDSLVSVAPVFWALLGIGICCNYMVTNNIPQKAEIKAQNNKKMTKNSAKKGR